MTDILTREPGAVDAEIAREIEAFLYHEAELLDAWSLTEWLGLLTDQCCYLVPATDTPSATSPAREVFIISDDYAQIVGRVERLNSELAFVEQPRSRTRRLIGNVRIQGTETVGYDVRSNFAVYRYRRGASHVFTGEYRHRLRRDPAGALRIDQRWAVLDSEALRPQGKVSFIL